MRNHLLISAVATLGIISTPAAAQTSTGTSSTGERIGQILGTIFGVGNAADNSLDGQWRAGRSPLTEQRTQFEGRVDAEVRTGRLTQATATRLKADYGALVDLEARYRADGAFSTAERSDLSARYDALTKVFAGGSYADGATANRAEIAEGQAEFIRRVDAQVSARRMTRTAATRLKADYAALIKVEAGYLRDGVITESERSDLDTRLDALDGRVGDVAYTTPATAKSRLDAIATALPKSGLTAAARAQLLVEHGDLVRLEAAYARLSATADERAYLDQRIANLETRARVVR